MSRGLGNAVERGSEHRSSQTALASARKRFLRSADKHAHWTVCGCFRGGQRPRAQGWEGQAKRETRWGLTPGSTSQLPGSAPERFSTTDSPRGTGASAPRTGPEPRGDSAPWRGPAAPTLLVPATDLRATHTQLTFQALCGPAPVAQSPTTSGQSPNPPGTCPTSTSFPWRLPSRVRPGETPLPHRSAHRHLVFCRAPFLVCLGPSPHSAFCPGPGLCAPYGSESDSCPFSPRHTPARQQ